MNDEDLQQIVIAAKEKNWRDTITDKEQLRMIKLAYAKAGIFNPQTLLDSEQRQRQWSNGKLGPIRDYFYLEQNLLYMLEHIY